MTLAALENALIDGAIPENNLVNRQKRLHPDLPRLLYAVHGASMNDALRAEAASMVLPSGKASPKSRSAHQKKAVPVNTQREYLRPNGSIYYARKWGVRLDVDVLKATRTAHQYPLFTGAPGTGKTALFEGAFGEESLTIVITGDTEVHDLVGQFVPDATAPSGYAWQNGILTDAVEQGRPLLLDEIGLGQPKVMAILYSLMDGRDELIVTGNADKGVIKAAPGFFIVGAYNPDAPGVQMSEALLSRFTVQVEVTTDYGLAKELGVDPDIVAVAESLNTRKKENTISWAPQMRELLAFRDLTELFDIDFAVANLLSLVPEDERDIVKGVLKATVIDVPVKPAVI